MSNKASEAKGGLRIRDAFLQPSAWTMFFLGFASGLPFLLVAGTLSYWLRENGITLKDITMIASAGMAYSFKFLWAPLVDRLRLPLLGHLGQRRSWILLTQALVMIGLLFMASVTPEQLPLFVGLTLLVAFSGATLDIAVDAYRIEIAPIEAQGALVATYSLGYRIALIASGALALVLADHTIWPNVYRAMAACMLIPLVATLLAREPQVLRVRAQTWAQGLREGVVEPFADFFRRFGGRVWLVSKCGPKVQARTRRWLDRHRFFQTTGIPYGQLRFCLNRRDKAPICDELGIGLFVDDRLDVLDAMRDVVEHRFQFGATSAPSGIVPAPTWAAAEEAILRALGSGALARSG